MSKRFLVLLTAFVILLSACLAVLLIANNPSWFYGNQNTVGFLKQLSTPSPAALTTLSLIQDNQTLITGQTNTLRVTIDSQGSADYNKPRVIQLELSFDPKAISHVTISPGDFFHNPKITLNLINQNTGRLSYALESTNEAQQTSGTVAIISFIPNPTFSGKETDIAFLPKTTIRTNGNGNMVTATYGTKLIFTNKNADPGL